MTDHVVDAPAAEAKLRKFARRYEIARTSMVAVVLVVVSLSGAKLLSLAQDNKASLNILRCAISKEVRTNEDGTPTTHDQAQVRFDACLKRGGPEKNSP